MKELMTDILAKWNQYWDGGYFLWIFAAALIYLILFHRKKEHIKYVLWYVGVILFLFWCPITAFVIRKCIGADVYWRCVWMLLSVPLTALAITEIISAQKKQLLKVIVTVLTLSIVAVSGKSMMSAGVYETAHNNQKIPYEAVVAVNIVNAHAAGEQVHLATDDYLAAYIRVYDASITMPYGRRGADRLDRNCKKLYNEFLTVEINYKRVAKLAKKTNCNYVVCLVRTPKDIEVMQKYGYEVIGEVGNYRIFTYAETE